MTYYRAVASIKYLTGLTAIQDGKIYEDDELVRTGLDLFAEAGEVLKEDASKNVKHRDKVYVWYLSATQFVNAGFYRRAMNLCRKVDARLLPSHHREGFYRFRDDVKKSIRSNKLPPCYVS